MGWFVSTKEKWEKQFPFYSLKKVPFSRIKILNITTLNSRTVGPPRLVKHNDGFYTVEDGKHRLYEYFADMKNNTKKLNHQLTMNCLVLKTTPKEVQKRLDKAKKEGNEIAIEQAKNIPKLIAKPSFGVFVWQLRKPYPQKPQTPHKDRLFGKSIFNELKRRKLPWKASRELHKLEKNLLDLYIDGKNRHHALESIAYAKFYPGGIDQQEHLKKYKKKLQALVLIDESKEKEEENLLGKFIRLIPEKDSLNTFKLFLIELHAILTENLKLCNGKTISREKINQLIEKETKLMKKFRYWS